MAPRIHSSSAGYIARATAILLVVARVIYPALLLWPAPGAWWGPLSSSAVLAYPLLLLCTCSVVFYPALLLNSSSAAHLPHLLLSGCL